jgi:hypothetical protein
MGIKDWLKKKGHEKSASNIINGLRHLVAAVRVDFEGASGQSNQVAALRAGLEQGRKFSEAELAVQTQAMESWYSRKTKVIDAQKRLYKDLALWSSLSPELSFNEIILPALFSGQFVAPSEPCFEPVIVAVYRVCEVAARQNGVVLEAHTTPEILQIVKDAGDLYT